MRRAVQEEGQFPLQDLELGDPVTDLGVPPVDELGDDPARCLAAVAHRSYDLVLLDVPAGLTPLTAQALSLCDEVLGVLTPTASAWLLLPAAEEGLHHLRSGRPPPAYLVNQVDTRRPLHRDTLASLQAALGARVLSRVVQWDPAVPVALARSRSLFHSTDISTLRDQHPDLPILHELSDDTRLVVSEPLGDLRGAWREVPEATCVVVRGGSEQLVPFAPVAPAGAVG